MDFRVRLHLDLHYIHASATCDLIPHAFTLLSWFQHWFVCNYIHYRLSCVHLIYLILPQDNPPYDKGAFRIEIIFPAEYPFKPPKITFKTKIYHPNIDEKGQVCLPVISAENWKPATKTDQGEMRCGCLTWVRLIKLGWSWCINTLGPVVTSLYRNHEQIGFGIMFVFTVHSFIK